MYIPKGSQICASASNSGKSVNYYRKDKTRIDYWSLSSSTSDRYYRGFSLSEDTYYWKFTDGTTEPQIEVGSLTPTEYEAPNGTTLSVSFPDSTGTVYGGTLDVVSGELVVDYEYVVLTGTESYSKSSRFIGSFYRQTGTYHANNNHNICSHLKKSEILSSYSVGSFLLDGANNANINLWVTSEDWTIQQFKDYIAGQYNNGTPVSFVLKLQSPITYQLTPQEISTLRGENNVWGDGNIELTYKAQSS